MKDAFFYHGMVTLVMSAKDIIDGTKVRKQTGTKPYTLRTDIKLYGEGAQLVKTDVNVRFIVSEDGCINIVSPDAQLAVDFELDDAIEYLEEIRRIREIHQ